MATIVAGNIVKEDLVFAYDTGYGVSDNNSSTRFYPGESTDNKLRLFTSNTLSYPTNRYRVTVTEQNTVDSSAPNGQYSRYTGIDGSDNNQVFYSYAGSGFSYTGQTITYSVYLKGNGTCHLTTYDDQSGYGTSGTITLTNQWVRYSYTRSVSSSASSHWSGVRGILSSTDVYVAASQMEIKGHSTPFTPTTRSDTASLIDLAKTTDIDVSNISFDSTGQPTFDGTNDYIEATVTSITNATSLTISYWFKMNWATYWSPFVTLLDSNGTQKFHTWFGSDRGIDFQTSINSVKPMFVASSTNYPNNEYINVVMVINGEGTNNVKCYVNAIYKAQGSLSFNTHDIDKLRIGRDLGSSYGGGHMPRLAIYNVPLTEQEIKQNYNAHKNRFDI